MTKLVRIENADLNKKKLIVEVWQRGANGEPDQCISTIDAPTPTQMVAETVDATRYLVVREG